jgi:hypothetical protein
MLAHGSGFPVDVTIDGKALLESANLAASTRALPNGAYETRYAAARGEIIERFAPFPALGKNAWRLRSITYANRSAATQDLTEAVMRLAPQVRANGEVWQPDWFWMGESAGAAVHVAYQGDADYYSLLKTPIGVESRVYAQWRLKPGESAQIDAQGVWISSGGAASFRDEAQRWHRAVGIRVAPNKPAWLSRSIWYEASAGGVESRFSDTGGFEAFSHQLDYLANLGISAM